MEGINYQGPIKQVLFWSFRMAYQFSLGIFVIFDRYIIFVVWTFLSLMEAPGTFLNLNFCLVVTVLIRLLLSIWDVKNQNSISNKLFFRWQFFLVFLSQINFSDCDINFPRNQYEMSGKSDICLWCLIHVL